MTRMEFATLNNGVKMPMAGIGTFLLTPDEAETSVLSALQCGYRLIDTANAYVNEKAVGRAMKKSGVERKDIFLETKLWPSFYEQADAVDKTLERLDTDYIDLLLIHQPAGNYVAGYKQMEKAYQEGKVKAIGLSNFNTRQIQEILDICEVKPAVLQTEVHPYDAYFGLNKVMNKLKDLLQSLASEYMIVFLVDELDRCLPEYAIKVLERLHHLTEGKSDIITIISIDKEQLLSSIKRIFGFNNPARYLEKFINFEVKLDYGIVSDTISEKYADYNSLLDKDIFQFEDPVEE